MQPSDAPTHPSQLTSHVKLLQKVVLTQNNDVLLLQRSNTEVSRPGCWDFPGGNSEWPTDQLQPISNLHQLDAAREVEEETGIRLSPEQFSQQALVYFETFFDPKTQVFTVLCGWHIELPSTFSRESVRTSSEHSAHTWTSRPAALEFDFGGNRGAFLPRILQSIPEST